MTKIKTIVFTVITWCHYCWQNKAWRRSQAQFELWCAQIKHSW